MTDKATETPPQPPAVGGPRFSEGLGPTAPLVERLRARRDFMSMDLTRWYMTSTLDPDCQEAATEIERLRAALQRIARWHGEFPATGQFWDEEKTRPTSYAAEYGSNGERDFMRQVARDALGPNVRAKRGQTAQGEA